MDAALPRNHHQVHRRGLLRGCSVPVGRDLDGLMLRDALQHHRAPLPETTLRKGHSEPVVPTPLWVVLRDGGRRGPLTCQIISFAVEVMIGDREILPFPDKQKKMRCTSPDERM